MSIKWSRESILVALMSLMVLVGAFYYGNLYLIEPIKQENQILSDTVRGQEILLNNYPPSEDLKEEYEEAYLATNDFLPLGAQANKELVLLERLANQAGVNISGVSRTANDQSMEDVPVHFVKSTYSVQASSESPANFRNLIDRLMEEERVWNIVNFSYTQSGEGNVTGTFSYELPYYSAEPNPEEIPEEVEETENETGEVEV